MMYYAGGDEKKPEVDASSADAEISDFLRHAGRAVYAERPGQALRGSRSVLHRIASLYQARDAALPVLALSWAFLQLSELMNLAVLRDSFVWASRDELLALHLVEMADAVQRRQWKRTAHIISKSYDPDRHSFTRSVRRRIGGEIPASLHHRPERA